MSKQDQRVSEGGEAYQAGESITVHRGISPEQMSEIMISMATQLGTYFSTAEATANQRISDLRDEILAEFASSTSDARSEAFLEPDYQFVVREAQESFARNGEEWLKKELVRLLSVRSTQDNGSRTALILNEAISIAGNLTQEEYSALVICFLFKQMRVTNPNSDELFRVLNGLAVPFIEDLPSDNHAYDYLEAMRCVSINLIAGTDLWSSITENYRMNLSKGFSVDRLNGILAVNGGVREIGNLLFVVDVSKVRFTSNNREELVKKLHDMGYPADAIGELLELHDGGLMNEEEIKNYVRSVMPTLAAIEAVWSETKLHQSVHTALGKALAHSALVSRADFAGPLAVWVR